MILTFLLTLPIELLPKNIANFDHKKPFSETLNIISFNLIHDFFRIQFFKYIKQLAFPVFPDDNMLIQLPKNFTIISYRNGIVLKMGELTPILKNITFSNVDDISIEIWASDLIKIKKYLKNNNILTLWMIDDLVELYDSFGLTDKPKDDDKFRHLILKFNFDWFSSPNIEDSSKFNQVFQHLFDFLILKLTDHEFHKKYLCSDKPNPIWIAEFKKTNKGDNSINQMEIIVRIFRESVEYCKEALTYKKTTRISNHRQHYPTNLVQKHAKIVLSSNYKQYKNALDNPQNYII